MPITDVDNAQFASEFNAFKNEGMYDSSLVIPSTSYGSLVGKTYTKVINLGITPSYSQFFFENTVREPGKFYALPFVNGGPALINSTGAPFLLFLNTRVTGTTVTIVGTVVNLDNPGAETSTLTTLNIKYAAHFV